jgi:hypothetical protein
MNKVVDSEVHWVNQVRKKAGRSHEPVWLNYSGDLYNDKGVCVQLMPLMVEWLLRVAEYGIAPEFDNRGVMEVLEGFG